MGFNSGFKGLSLFLFLATDVHFIMTCILETVRYQPSLHFSCRLCLWSKHPSHKQHILTQL